MPHTLLRAGALSCALLASTALTAPATAQSSPPPRFNQVDANGVDLVTGDYFFSMVEGTIGAGEGMLSLVRNWAGPAGWTDNWSGALYTRTSGGTARIVVEFGSYSDTFSISGGTYTSTKADGATLTDLGGAFRYTASDGTEIDFASVSDLGYPISGPVCARADNGTCAIPMAIRRPNGMTHSLAWDVEERCFQLDAQLQCVSSGAYPRFRGVSNSANYSFTIGYATDTPGSGVPASNWFVRTGAQFTNLDSAPATLPTVTYSSPAAGVTQVVDTGGQTWRLTNGSAGRLSAIRRPGASADTTTISYGTGTVAVTREGVATSYSRYVSGSGGLMTVTDANGQETLHSINLTKERITSMFDAASRTTSFSYDDNSRLTGVTMPEGNSVRSTYDARGNVTETRAVAKSGSGLSDIVTSASYSSTCSNPIVCNRPNSTTDARDNVTDYTYDSAHGGILSVTAPAPSSGAARPQVRYSYSQVTSVSGQPVTLLTGVSACQSGTASACLGTAEEGRSVIAYDSDNLRTTSVTARNGDNSLSATSAYTYDAIGNRLTVDGPLAGTADTTRLRYNSARQVTGAVGPDPDGAGGLKHRAVRTTYAHGLPTIVETGTVDSQSDSDWAAISVLQRVEQDYDANARTTASRLISGSTTYALSQTGYDSLGRVRCVAQRMNPAEFASPPTDACALDNEGSFGPDRIGRVSYDALGRPTLVETGVGTAAEADEAATGYTANGQAETVTDANGNRTTYEYDGFDRLVKTRMPEPATAGTSSTTDYEQLGYDAAGNVVSRRLRDGQTIQFSYDALGRMTYRNIPSPVTGESDVAYYYDNLGRVTSIQDALGHYVNRTYDPLGRVTLETTETGQRGVTTDAAGQPILIGWDGGPNIAYDRLVTGEVWRMRENPAYANYTLATFAYDDQGRRTSLTRGNGASTTYGYDAVSRLTQLAQNLNGTTNDLTLDFTYNPAGEIVTNTRSNDAYSFTGHANANVANTINGLNQVTQTGGTNVGHGDDRGNITSVGSTNYAYTTEDRLSTGGSATLTYNPEGTLLSETGAATTRFDTLGGNIITERDGSGNRLRRFVPGPGVDEHIVWYEGSDLNTRRYHHQDERGSVIAVSDASGNLVGNVNRYDEYGVPQGTLTGRFGYTGQPWIPEAGLYHYRARAYNPAMGRFMQTDPIGFGGGMNIYAYVRNNPVNRSDPTGLECGGSPCPDVTANRDSRCDDEATWWDADSRHKMHCDQGGLILTFFAMGSGSVGGGSGGGGEMADQGQHVVVVATRPRRRLSDCQQRFLARELGNRGLPARHLADVRFVSGLDRSAGYFTRQAWANPDVSAVTQGNTIYVRPELFDSFANFQDWRAFEEIAHTAQFIEAGSPGQFYHNYGAAGLAGGGFGYGFYEGNLYEVIAKAQGRQMSQSARGNMCR